MSQPESRSRHDAEGPTRVVGFPIYDGCTLLDFGGATQVFAFAEGYQVAWLAPTLDPVSTTEGVQVLPTHTFEEHPALDILFVPGGGASVARVMQDPLWVDFVRSRAGDASHVGSVCSGAFILAAAGLLDGYSATTYWNVRDTLALFPKITVVEGYPRWVIHEDRFTGGGVSSSIDLALEIVHRLSGAEDARLSQLRIQYAPSPPFDSGDPSTASPETVAAVRTGQQAWTRTMREATEAVIAAAAS